MSINLGNKKFKKLYRGDELITHIYKGDELIYIDLESLYAYKLTIDTRLKQDGTSDPTDDNMVFGIDRIMSAGILCLGRAFKVYWGDGTQTVIDTSNTSTNYTTRHQYQTPGEYQVSIVPIKFVNKLPVKGWLSPLCSYGGPDFNTGVTYNASPWKIKSIDTPVPERGICLGFQSGQPDYGRKSLNGSFGYMSNIESVPDGWLDNVEFRDSGIDLSATFREFAKNGKAQNPNQMLEEIHTLFVLGDGKVTTGQTTFHSAFCGYDEVIIPDDFMNLTPTGSYDSNLLSGTFRSAFQNCKKVVFGERLITLNFPTQTSLRNFSAGQTFMDSFKLMEDVTWPECLIKIIAPEAKDASIYWSQTFLWGFTIKSGFSSVLEINNKFIDYQIPKLEDGTGMFGWCLPETSASFQIKFKTGTFKITNKIKSAEGMFNWLFYSAGGWKARNTVWEQGAIEIDTSQCTNTSKMFHHLLWEAPITNGVIVPMDTSNVTNFSQMFSTEQTTGARNDAIIWQDLISSTANGVNFNRMFWRTYKNRFDLESTPLTSNFFNLNTSNGADFSGMFEECFAGVRIEIPTGFFSNIDTTSGTTFTNMFKSFNERSTSTPRFQLNDFFDGMPSYNFATQANVDDGLVTGMFAPLYGSGYNFLDGSASTVLQHFPFDPTIRTYMLNGQNRLTDYATINANWK